MEITIFQQENYKFLNLLYPHWPLYALSLDTIMQLLVHGLGGLNLCYYENVCLCLLCTFQAVTDKASMLQYLKQDGLPDPTHFMILTNWVSHAATM